MGQNSSRTSEMSEQSAHDDEQHHVLPTDIYIAFFNIISQIKYPIPFEILYEIFFQYAGFTLPRRIICNERKTITNGSRDYLSVSLFPSPNFTVVSAHVVLESKDQGWSSYPAQHGTRENSNTWGTIKIASINYQPNNESSEFFLYRNLHAGRSYERFSWQYTDASPLLKELQRVWSLPQSVGAARSNIGDDSRDNNNGNSVVDSSGITTVNNEVPSVTLTIKQHAMYPGWVNKIRYGEICVEMVPTEEYLRNIWTIILNRRHVT